MKRVDIITIKGKSIVVVDASNMAGKDIVDLLAEAKKVIASQGSKSALVITEVTNAKYDKQVAEAVKDYASSNSPYIKASAVVGAEGIQLVLLQTAIFLTRREIKTFKARQEAAIWLAS